MIQVQKNLSIIGNNSMPIALDCFFLDDAKAKPIVVYLHGFNGFKDWGNFDLITNQFAQARYFFVKFNFSHNGTSLQSPEAFVNLEAFGNNNFSKELFDVNAVLNWICDVDNSFAKQFDVSKITLLGHSRGGGVAIIAASEDQRVSSLITWASVSACKTPWGNMKPEKLEHWRKEGVIFYANKRTQQQMPLYYQLYEDYLEHQNRLDIQKAISHLNIPILICHGTLDTAVPIDSAHLLKKWQPNAELFILDTDHVFDRKHPWLEPDLPKASALVVDASLRFLKKKA